MSRTIAVADIGGTHARFAIAELRSHGVTLGAETVFKTGDYPGLRDAWQAYGRQLARPLPKAAAVSR